MKNFSIEFAELLELSDMSTDKAERVGEILNNILNESDSFQSYKVGDDLSDMEEGIYIVEWMHVDVSSKARFFRVGGRLFMSILTRNGGTSSPVRLANNAELIKSMTFILRL